ncbi:molybdopterin-dependent oxidoreductase [Streptomyces sp. NPDC058257]|uniref:molybdopterin-dependent oxidoreductase n=1 Tax=Streptomyces sp. NPDC058257 TaxID=3346409 RepID=UPI0036E9D98E
MKRTSLGEVSTPGRVAAPGEGIGEEELALAARNHGLPLEALRYDVTPLGLHYVLVHYDIPAVDAGTWRLSVGGQVRAPLELGLDELRALASVIHRVTMECAGNGRARLSPRPVSQPWLVEAVGTADCTGVPLRTVLAEADVGNSAVEAVFTGADHGDERGVEQDYRRGLSLPVGADVLLAYAMNSGPLPPQHGCPPRLVVPGWYGMAHVKRLRAVELVDTPFTGFQQASPGLRRRRPYPAPGPTVEPRRLRKQPRTARPCPVPLIDDRVAGEPVTVQQGRSTRHRRTHV